MPTKVPKAGTRRSGQGIAAPALQKPIVKNFDPPRPPWLSGAGGSPSSAADTNWSQRLQRVTSEDDLEYEFEEGECGCNSMNVCSCPRTSIIMKNETLLRNYIRASILTEVHRDSNIVIDEDEEELEEEEIDEFSGVAALGGGPSLPLGMSTPTFGRKRRKKGKEVKGWKTTHG